MHLGLLVITIELDRIGLQHSSSDRIGLIWFGSRFALPKHGSWLLLPLVVDRIVDPLRIVLHAPWRRFVASSPGRIVTSFGSRLVDRGCIGSGSISTRIGSQCSFAIRIEVLQFGHGAASIRLVGLTTIGSGRGRNKRSDPGQLPATVYTPLDGVFDHSNY